MSVEYYNIILDYSSKSIMTSLLIRIVLLFVENCNNFLDYSSKSMMTSLLVSIVLLSIENCKNFLDYFSKSMMIHSLISRVLYPATNILLDSFTKPMIILSVVLLINTKYICYQNALLESTTFVSYKLYFTGFFLQVDDYLYACQ